MQKHASQSANGCSFAYLEIIKPPCEKLLHSSSNPTKFLEKIWQHSLQFQQKFIGICRQLWELVPELAKFHMYKIYFDIMKTNFECKHLYSDIDSLLYEIKKKKRNIPQKFQKKKHFK